MPIAANGGLEAVAAAMTNHADHRGVQEQAALAVGNIVWNIGNHIALAKAAGLVPLLRHAAGMGFESATKQLGRMGV